MKKVGKTIIVGADKSKKAGFYCDVCDCLLTDSKTYLDHINGRNHQKKLGMSMHVARISTSQVAQKLHKESVLAKGRAAGIVEKKETVAERLKRLERQAEEKRKYKGKKRPHAEVAAATADDQPDSDAEEEDGGKWPRNTLSADDEARELELAEQRAMEMMKGRQFDVVEAEAAEEDWEEEESEDEGLAARLAALKGAGAAGGVVSGSVEAASGSGEAAKAEAEEDDEDVALMAAMGFGGFGTSSKKR